MHAFPIERALAGPGGNDQIIRFLGALAVEGGVDAGGELLLPAAATKPETNRPFEIMSIIVPYTRYRAVRRRPDRRICSRT